MVKKWKKIIKIFATTVIVLLYVTIGLLNNETLKKDEGKKKTFSFESVVTTEKNYRTVKTIISYSDEFRIRRELEDRIECERKVQPPEKSGRGRSLWRSEQKLGVEVFSAYYDQRQEPYHYVRIIGLVRRNASFYCQIWYNNTTTMETRKAVIQEIWSPKWEPNNKDCEIKYPAIINCLTSPDNKSTPSWVSFVDKSCNGSSNFVKIQHPSFTPPEKRKNFVICVKPINFQNFKKEDLMEWVKINIQLGAERIVFYGYNATVPLEFKMVEWRKFETAQHKSCSPGRLEEPIWHKRKMEIVAYNDCFYSNLYNSKFVIPLDVDEIIVPKTGNNWFEAFRTYFLNGELTKKKNGWPEDTEKYASFSVRNAYFFPHYPKQAFIKGLTLPKTDENVPVKLVMDSSIFDRSLRSSRLSPKSDSVKSFIHVPKTLSVFNHYAFHVLGDASRQFIFPENAFLLHHYRNSCDPVLIDGCQGFLNQVVFDNSLEKFRKMAKRVV